MGGEFRPLSSYCQNHGIVHRLICPHTHHQNGVVKRKHRHIVELGMTLLMQASLPIKFWDFAFQTFVYLINMLPTSSLQFQVPYTVLFHKSPDYAFLRNFGCSCYPFLRPYNKHKLEFRSHECIFLGYSPSHKGYKCLSPSGHLYVSKDVAFNELKYPFHGLFPATSNKSVVSPIVDTLPNANIPIISSSPSTPSVTNQFSPPTNTTSTIIPHKPVIIALVSGQSPGFVSHSSPPHSSPQNIHPMQTRSKVGVFKPKIHLSLLLTTCEPNSVKQALVDP